MKKSCAYIVIDSGFSAEVLSRTKKVLAAWDLVSQQKFVPQDKAYLSKSQLESFAGDPMGHGSIVLERFLRQRPEAKFILVKAFENRSACRTRWQSGEIARAGWTESYVWAAELAEKLGMVSVANCSFGGYFHAVDGSGWEAHQLAKCTGAGKPGHLLAAAAGPGDARPVHARMKLLAFENKTIICDQHEDSDYNLWFALRQGSNEALWSMEARLNGQLVFASSSGQVPENFWNKKRQLTFRIPGRGRVELDFRRHDAGAKALSVDAWCETVSFRNWVSAELVGEPACFEQTIAVGLAASSYSCLQEKEGTKPEVLLSGGDQISFRLPEVCVYLGELLEKNPELDLPGVRQKLNKFLF